MKLIHVTAVACALLITGCVISDTRNDLRNDRSPVEYSSVKSAKVVALCISDEWDRIRHQSIKVQMRETSNGYAVWAEQSLGGGVASGLAGASLSMKDSVVYMVDIDNTKSGSITRYYTYSLNEHALDSTLNKCINDGLVQTIATPENSTPEPQSSSSASQKLRELQVLKKDGLITEDEFQSKKKQLLEKL